MVKKESYCAVSSCTGSVQNSTKNFGIHIMLQECVHLNRNNRIIKKVKLKYFRKLKVPRQEKERKQNELK